MARRNASRRRGLTPAAGRGLPRPRKRYGQHFLEAAWVRKLIDALNADPSDVFLEIGPGRGALTGPLAERVARVIAVEIDRDLAAALPTRVGANVRIVQGDFLDVDLAQVLDSEAGPVRIVGNLPYNVSSPILFRLLDAAASGIRIPDATLMLQREVADRLVARAGTSEYGALAIQVALLARVERLLALPPGAFRPPPKVHSTVVRLIFHPPSVEIGDRDVFERIVRGVFLQRRKTVLNALKPVADALSRSPGGRRGDGAGTGSPPSPLRPPSVPAEAWLERAGIDPRRRPETLTLDDFARLSQAVL